MPFVKLDTGILDSSLWSEPSSTRICWITLLAMADCTGLVKSTAPGIAKRANLGTDETAKALEIFESPDEHSRSLNDQGKKIRRVDGGYQIINYQKYRDYDYTAAERMRRFRELRRNERNKPNKTVTLRKQKQSTEAEAEGKGKNPLTIPSLLLRVYGWFGKRPTTLLDESEQRAWRNSCLIVEQTPSDEWDLLEWVYKTKQQYRRKDLATLLNNWNCEIQRAREWKNGSGRVGGRVDPNQQRKDAEYEKFMRERAERKRNAEHEIS